MCRTPCDDIGLASPGLQNGYRECSGTAKTKQADPFARLYSGNTQAPKADDTCAEERCDVDRVESLRYGKRKIRAHERILGVPSINGIASERRMIAKVLHVVLAEPAISIRAAHP